MFGRGRLDLKQPDDGERMGGIGVEGLRDLFQRCLSMGKETDRELSAVERRRKMARIEKEVASGSDDSRKGIRSVETDKDAKRADRLHVTARFGLKRIKRLYAEERACGYWGG